MSSVSLEQRNQAEEDYANFFNMHPSQKNPGDINTKETFEFAVEIGWERLRVMQACRKNGEAFTRPQADYSSN